jgi:hypothetical protein
MTVYSGTALGIGSFQDSLGEQFGHANGLLEVTLLATLDSAGNGIATGAVNSDATIEFAPGVGPAPGFLPIPSISIGPIAGDISTPSFTVQNRNFQFSEQIPLSLPGA